MNKHIQEHVEILNSAIDLFKYEGPEEVHFCGKLVGLSGWVFLNGGPTRLEQFPQLLSSIAHRLWNIAILVNRLDEMKRFFIENRELDDVWRRYASLDIEHIYVDFRSLCDYLATLVWCYFDKVPDSKRESLEKLLTWLWKNQGRVDDDLINCMNKAKLLADENNFHRTWFGHMRAIRNDIVHRGANTIVFGYPADGILFQVMKVPTKKAIPALPHIKYNENSVIHFDKYLALQLANLFVFTEILSEVIMQNNAIDTDGAISTGFSNVYTWLLNFRDELSEYQ